MHYLTCCMLLDMLLHVLSGTMSHIDPETQIHALLNVLLDVLLDMLLDMMTDVLIWLCPLITQRHSYMHYLTCCMLPDMLHHVLIGTTSYNYPET